MNDKTFMSYLVDIFEKLNILNKHLQETNKTLIQANDNLVSLHYLTARHRLHTKKRIAHYKLKSYA